VAIEKTALGRAALAVDQAFMALPHSSLRALAAVATKAAPIVRAQHAELEGLLSPAFGDALVGLAVELGLKAARGMDRAKKGAREAWDLMRGVRSFVDQVLAVTDVTDGPR
jgi:hypothetical protein